MNSSNSASTSPGHGLFHLARRVSNRLFGPNLIHRSAAFRMSYRAFLAAYEWASPKHRAWRAYMRANPDAPWFVPEAVPYAERMIGPGVTVFEWGTGRSTIWMAKRGATVVSVEGRKGWYEAVIGLVAKERVGQMVRIRLVEVPMEYDFPPEVVTAYAGAIRAYPPHMFDLVVVDGHFRNECLAAIGDRIKPNGVLLVDNADRSDLQGQLSKLRDTLLVRFDNGISRTDFYRVPAEGLPPGLATIDGDAG